MNASSRDAFCGVNSCRTMPLAAASSPMAAASSPVTSMAPSVSGRTLAPAACRWAARSVDPRRAHPDRALGAGLDEVVDALVPDEPAPADDDEVVGGERHLAHEMAGHQDGSPLGGQRPHQGADPDDALGSSPLTGSSNISTAGSPSRAAAMPSRWPMPSENPLARRRATDSRPTISSTSFDPPSRDAVALGQAQQMVVGAAPAVHGLGVEKGPDLAQRSRQVPVALAGDGHLTAVRMVEPEDHPHGRGLAGAVGPKEPVTIPACTSKLRSSTATVDP